VKNQIQVNSKGEPGQSLFLCRFCCWMGGQIEAQGPRGICGVADGDCWYSAQMITFSAPNLGRKYSQLEHGATFINGLERHVLNCCNETPSYCFPRGRKSPILSVEVTTSADIIKVLILNDSRLKISVRSIGQSIYEKLPDGPAPQVLIVESADYGPEYYKEIWRKSEFGDSI